MVAVTRARERLPITLVEGKGWIEGGGKEGAEAGAGARPDERDISDRQETDEHRATDDPRVPGVVPVHQRADLAGHQRLPLWPHIAVIGIG